MNFLVVLSARGLIGGLPLLWAFRSDQDQRHLASVSPRSLNGFRRTPLAQPYSAPLGNHFCHGPATPHQHMFAMADTEWGGRGPPSPQNFKKFQSYLPKTKIFLIKITFSPPLNFLNWSEIPFWTSDYLSMDPIHTFLSPQVSLLIHIFIREK